MSTAHISTVFPSRLSRLNLENSSSFPMIIFQNPGAEDKHVICELQTSSLCSEEVVKRSQEGNPTWNGRGCSSSCLGV